MKKFYSFLFKILIIFLGLIIYSRYVGTSGLITKEYSFKTNIPDSFDGLKIVHFSDIHYNRIITIDKINEVINEINLINPDIVFFTGDLIDEDMELKESDFEDLTDMLSKINSKYGKYAILGEHDYSEKEKVLKVYKDSNFHLLDNEYDIIYNNTGEKIFIGGLGNVTKKDYDIDKTMDYFKGENTEDIYKILLIHEPDITDKVLKNYDVNLILAGHSHNGQVRLPYIGTLYKPENAKKYYDNYYKINNTRLYISSGIGVSDMNYRLFNKPSINFYRINKKANDK